MTRILLILFTGLVATFTVEAQDEPRWYEVEVIVFAHEGWTPADARLYRDPGVPDTRGALKLLLEDEAGQNAEPAVPLLASAADAPVPDSEKIYPVDALTGHRIYDAEHFMQLPPERQFEVLEPGEFQLTSSWRALDRSSLYRPLLHVAWRQPVMSRETAIPVRLAAGPIQNMRSDADVFDFQLLDPALSDTAIHELDGTGTLMLSRYVHLQFDLVYRERLFPAPTGYSGSAARLYRLEERRRIRRPDELHYFDHPRLGVIAQLRRWEFPAPPESEETLDESDLRELGTLPDPPDVN